MSSERVRRVAYSALIEIADAMWEGAYDDPDTGEIDDAEVAIAVREALASAVLQGPRASAKEA